MITNTRTCISYHPDSRVKIPKDEYAPLSTIQEPKWRVRTLLHKRIADGANKTKYISKFANKIDEVFTGLPKPKDWITFAQKDLPLLFTASEVQQFALEHRLNKAQTQKVLLKTEDSGYRNPEVCLGTDFS